MKNLMMGENSILSDPPVGSDQQADKVKTKLSTKLYGGRRQYKYESNHFVEHTTSDLAIELSPNHIHSHHEQVIIYYFACHVILHHNEINLKFAIQCRR